LTSTLLPYTTLFRSWLEDSGGHGRLGRQVRRTVESPGKQRLRSRDGGRPAAGAHGRFGLRGALLEGRLEKVAGVARDGTPPGGQDRKSTRLNSSHEW